ncbi:sporulation-delaying protein SdpB family protein [Streptomyces violascens]|uniref:sporulation-delaying protein SdpB family protein n=1 Tax=Streptomyces violascens TaxID=67381 RepID=UPI00365760B7
MADRLARRTGRHDLRSRWFGVGRTVIALAQLSVLLLTPVKALLVPVVAMGEYPRCDSVRGASALCLGGDALGMEPRRWLLIAILVAVASGYRPRWTAIPHAWASYSVAVSIAVPDGGESIGMIMSLLMIPIALADGRTWHWQPPVREQTPSWRTVSFVAFLAIRVQIAYLYLDSAVSKFGVADWANGTAEYYFLRDNMFGVGQPWDSLFLWMSRSAPVVTALTWGALVIEIAIGVCVLSSDRRRKAGMVMDIVLHGSIILTMGLWSFAVVMIGSAIVCATPERGRPERVRVPDVPPAEPKVRHCAECGALPTVAAVP